MILEANILGLTLAKLTARLRAEHGLGASDEGLLVMAVDMSSEAYEKGLRAGDLISEAGNRDVASVTDLEKQLSDLKVGGRKSVLFLTRRQGDPRFVVLKLE